jgi:hypothetical protein
VKSVGGIGSASSQLVRGDSATPNPWPVKLRTQVFRITGYSVLAKLFRTTIQVNQGEGAAV